MLAKKKKTCLHMTVEALDTHDLWTMVTETHK